MDKASNFMAKGMTYVESDVEEVQRIFDTDTNKVVVNDPTKRVECSLHVGHRALDLGLEMHDKEFK